MYPILHKDRKKNLVLHRLFFGGAKEDRPTNQFERRLYSIKVAYNFNLYCFDYRLVKNHGNILSYIWVAKKQQSICGSLPLRCFCLWVAEAVKHRLHKIIEKGEWTSFYLRPLYVSYCLVPYRCKCIRRTFFTREMLMLDYTELIGVSEPGESFLGRKEQVEIKCLRLLELEGVRDKCNQEVSLWEYRGRLLSRLRANLCLCGYMFAAQRMN